MKTTQPTLEMRPVKTEEDMRQVAALGEVIWHESFADIITPEQIEYMLEHFQSYAAVKAQRETQGYEYFLAYVDNKPVGYTGLVPQPQEGRLMLSKLYTLKSCHGTGLAGRMFAFIQKQAEAYACHTIWLTVNRHNDRAIAAYKKWGFTIVREQVADIGGGFVMDDYVMEKKI